MSETQTISKKDVGTVEAAKLLGRPEPKLVESRVRDEVDVPARKAQVVPVSVRIDWGQRVTDAVANVVHEAAVTSVTVHGTGGVAEHRRGPGDLALEPAADLEAAAAEVRAAKTYEDLAVAATRALAAGVKR